ncbi:MAG: hypothetical protein Q7S40_24495 [Opitutaceae bacterium]|nr:hypothetical protein [Opitutaceae bacterium]
MNSSHSVKLRPKTLARVRSIAHELETPVSAVLKHAVEAAMAEAWKNKCVAVPIRAQKDGKAREALDPSPQPVRLEPDTDARLRTIVEQIPLLKVSSVIRGAIEQFVDTAFHDKQVVFRFRAVRARLKLPTALPIKPRKMPGRVTGATASTPPVTRLPAASGLRD